MSEENVEIVQRGVCADGDLRSTFHQLGPLSSGMVD
jgi:hypothetical protein